MEQLPFIHLRSPKLRVLPGEDGELVNEGTYGKSLAVYLQTRLAERGHQTPAVVCEDWGWWLTISGLPFTCGLCIYGRRINDSDDLDLCVTLSAARGKKWNWSKFRFIDTTAEVDKLQATLRSILAEDPDITVIGEIAEMPFD